MSQEQDNFIMCKDEEHAQAGDKKAGSPGCGMGCPLANIPADTWARFIKPPFRKRHPIIFWLLILMAMMAILAFILCWNDEDEILDRDKCIALVSINGPIMDPSSTLSWIAKIERSKGVKGVLVRVDSPGGGAAASQEIYAALKRVGKKMPLAVSMGSTAASGGLMVSMAGHKIFANPSTVTGSIGVRMDIPQLQGLMGKIGVGQETLVTAPYKDAASYTHALSPQDRAYLENVLMNMHEQFVHIVANGRKMPLEKAKELASGKIFTGQQALELGLIDALGGQNDALEWLAARTKVPAANKLLKKPAKKNGILGAFLNRDTMREIVLGALHDIDAISWENSQPVFLYRY